MLEDVSRRILPHGFVIGRVSGVRRIQWRVYGWRVKGFPSTPGEFF